MAFECRLFPAKLEFPDAVGDVAALRGDETAVRLTGDARSFELLSDHAALRSLWCFGIDRTRLATIAACDRLEALYVEDVRVPDLEPLGALTNLRVLSIDGAAKVDSLAWLAGLARVEQLRLQHFARVHALDEIAGHPQLEALDVSGSMWTRMKVASFSPLRVLSELRFLQLTNIQARDGSLEPLTELGRLRTLHIAQFYDWKDIASLAGRMPDVDCPWFEPFVPLGPLGCDTCGTGKVMLTGRRMPTLCPTCEPDRVARHVERFQRARRQAASD